MESKIMNLIIHSIRFVIVSVAKEFGLPNNETIKKMVIKYISTSISNILQFNEC